MARCVTTPNYVSDSSPYGGSSYLSNLAAQIFRLETRVHRRWNSPFSPSSAHMIGF